MVEKCKFKYFCNDWDTPVKASVKSKNLCAYECGLLNLRDAIDEELKRIGSDGKWGTSLQIGKKIERGQHV